MSQEFVPHENASVSAALEEDCPNDQSAVSEQEVVLVTIVSSPSSVRETILTLYRLGFADVGDWSPLQRATNPKQVMSVLIRRKQSTQSKGDRTSGR